jgi:hypothetical protein
MGCLLQTRRRYSLLGVKMHTREVEAGGIVLPLLLSLGPLEVRAQRQVIQVKKVWF